MSCLQNEMEGARESSFQWSLDQIVGLQAIHYFFLFFFFNIAPKLFQYLHRFQNISFRRLYEKLRISGNKPKCNQCSYPWNLGPIF